jgi:hypothetical protein
MDARGLEHIIRAMQHRYVQCSRLGCAEVRNYRRKELQLLTEASGDEESQSLASELGHEDFLDRDGSGQAILFCFVLFGLQLSVCLWCQWLQVPLRILSDA